VGNWRIISNWSNGAIWVAVAIAANIFGRLAIADSNIVLAIILSSIGFVIKYMHLYCYYYSGYCTFVGWDTAEIAVAIIVRLFIVVTA